ncbi:hypothetical protein IAT38_002530 [Cryptococcus sp. DSM 104549]
MIAPPRRPKRSRSPSPSFEPDIASPLNLILKRRRREELGFASAEPDDPAHGFDRDAWARQQYAGFGDSGSFAESSSAAQVRGAESGYGNGTGAVGMGVERRRTRNWDRINAPPATPAGHPTPSPSAYPFPTPTNGHAWPHAQDPPMSSSPVRNQPPSSSPFRDTARREAEEAEQEEWMMDEEEMKREWGEAYTAQNSLLHSLHLARLNAQNRQPTPPRPSSMTTMQPQRTPLNSSQTLYAATSPYPYRQHPSSDSPFTPAQPQRSYAHAHSYGHRGNGHGGLDSPALSAGHGGDEEMVMEEEYSGAGEEEVRKRYEETNRLLGELAMVRQRRWGEAGPEEA